MTERLLTFVKRRSGVQVPKWAPKQGLSRAVGARSDRLAPFCTHERTDAQGSLYGCPRRSSLNDLGLPAEAA